MKASCNGGYEVGEGEAGASSYESRAAEARVENKDVTCGVHRI